MISPERWEELLASKDRAKADPLRWGIWLSTAESIELIEELRAARYWLRFIADTQHRLLEAFRMELSDEEWDAFAEALGISKDLQGGT